MRKFLIPAARPLSWPLGWSRSPRRSPRTPAATTIKVDAKVTPNKAGPRQAAGRQAVTAKVTVTTTGDVEHPIIESGDDLLPQGRALQGRKYTEVLDGHAEAAAAPTRARPSRSSAQGSGAASADTVQTGPKVTVVNGGKNLILATSRCSTRRACAPPSRPRSPKSGQVVLQAALRGAAVAADRRGHPDHAEQR